MRRVRSKEQAYLFRFMRPRLAAFYLLYWKERQFRCGDGVYQDRCPATLLPLLCNQGEDILVFKNSFCNADVATSIGNAGHLHEPVRLFVVWNVGRLSLEELSIVLQLGSPRVVHHALDVADDSELAPTHLRDGVVMRV